MDHLISLAIAAILLVLAILTDRLAKDPQEAISVFNKRKLAWIILVYALAYGVALFWNWEAAKGLPSFFKREWNWLDWLIPLGLVLFVLILQLVVEKVKPRSFGFCWPKNWRVLILPFVLFFSISLLNLNWRGSMKLHVIGIGTLSGMMEDVVFIAFIQNELERIFSIRRMWIVAGILFGLWHVPTDFWGYQFLHNRDYLFSFRQLALQIGGGIFGAAVYKKCRSVYPFFLLHWIGNNFHIYLFKSLLSL